MILAGTNGRDGADGLRWAASLAVVLGLHAGLVFLVLRHAPLPMEPPSEPEAVMLELPPEPTPAQPQAAPPLPEPMPPLPEPPVAEPPVALVPEPPPPQPAPEAVLPSPPPPRPPPPRPTPPRPAPPRPTPVRHAPPAPPRPAPAPAQPMPMAPAPAAPAIIPPPAAPSNAILGWRNALVGQLARAKRYPEGARSHGEQGTALATFTIDRSGHVLSASVTRSSGSYQLDEEAVALIRRAEPLPALPNDMPGATVTLAVPIAFALH